MSKTSVKQDYLSALAFLHCETQGRRITSEFQGNKDNITVLLDTSLIIAGIRPFIDGPAGSSEEDKGRKGLGQLLPRLPVSELGKKSIYWPAGKTPTLIALRNSEDLQAWHVTSALISKVYDIARGRTTNPSLNKATFQFASHFDETENIFDIVENKYDDRHRRRAGTESDVGATQKNYRRETIALAANTYLTSGGDLTNTAEVVMNRGEQAMLNWDTSATTLVREHEALRRLKAVGRAKRFEYNAFMKGQFPEAPRLPTKFVELEEHAREILATFFHNRVKYRKPRLSKLDADVQALVDLAVYNRRLIELDINHRIIFTTTDRNLILSAYAITRREIKVAIDAYCRLQLQLGNIGKDHADDIGDALTGYFILEESDDPHRNRERRWFQNFAAHYVRHIWAVAEDALIENPSVGGQSQMSTLLKRDLLSGLYAKVASRITVSRRAIEKLILSEKYLDEQALEDFDISKAYIHWNRLIGGKVKTWRLINAGLNGLEDQTPNPNDRAEALPNFVFFLLEEYSLRDRDRAMVHFSDQGAYDLIAQMPETTERGRPVDLSFKTLNETNRIFLNIADKNCYDKDHDESLRKFPTHFSAIDKDCFPGKHSQDEKQKGKVFDDRQRSYLKYLVLAAIFAAMEKWAAAQDHTRRACEIIERSDRDENKEIFAAIPVKGDDGIEVKPGEKSHMSGREGWYMDAICRRMLALTSDDFEASDDAWKKAQTALRGDIGNNEFLDHDFHAMRLTNEKWGWHIARYYFARLDEKNALGSKALRPSAPKEQIRALASLKCEFEFPQKADQFPEKISKNIQDLYKYLRKKTHKSQRGRSNTRLTTDAIALNFVQVALIRCFWTKQSKSNDKLFEFGNFDFDKAVGFSLRWLNRRAEQKTYIESPLVMLYRMGLPAVDEKFKNDRCPSFETSKQLNEVLELTGDKSSMKEKRVPYDIWRINNLSKFLNDNVQSGDKNGKR